MDQQLREWRQDALNRHQYDTAIMWADKVLAMTGAPTPLSFCLCAVC